MEYLLNLFAWATAMCRRFTINFPHFFIHTYLHIGLPLPFASLISCRFSLICYEKWRKTWTTLKLKSMRSFAFMILYLIELIAVPLAFESITDVNTKHIIAHFILLIDLNMNDTMFRKPGWQINHEFSCWFNDWFSCFVLCCDNLVVHGPFDIQAWVCACAASSSADQMRIYLMKWASKEIAGGIFLVDDGATMSINYRQKTLSARWEFDATSNRYVQSTGRVLNFCIVIV